MTLIFLFQIDTGASCSLIGLEAYKKVQSPSCSASTKVLISYGGNLLPTKGNINVDVEIGNQKRKLSLYVVNIENVTNIFEYGWFKQFNFQVECPYENLLKDNCFQIENYMGGSLEFALKNVKIL